MSTTALSEDPFIKQNLIPSLSTNKIFRQFVSPKHVRQHCAQGFGFEYDLRSAQLTKQWPVLFVQRKWETQLLTRMFVKQDPTKTAHKDLLSLAHNKHQ